MIPRLIIAVDCPRYRLPRRRVVSILSPFSRLDQKRSRASPLRLGGDSGLRRDRARGRRDEPADLLHRLGRLFSLLGDYHRAGSGSRRAHFSDDRQSSSRALPGEACRRGAEPDGPAHRARQSPRPDGGGGAAKPEALALVIADIDRFKKVNDTLGHLAGDDVIRSVGQMMVEALGEFGTVARVGGEEFALLSSGAPPETLDRKST